MNPQDSRPVAESEPSEAARLRLCREKSEGWDHARLVRGLTESIVGNSALRGSCARPRVLTRLWGTENSTRITAVTAVGLRHRAIEHAWALPRKLLELEGLQR